MKVKVLATRDDSFTNKTSGEVVAYATAIVLDEGGEFYGCSIRGEQPAPSATIDVRPVDLWEIRRPRKAA